MDNQWYTVQGVQNKHRISGRLWGRGKEHEVLIKEDNKRLIVYKSTSATQKGNLLFTVKINNNYSMNNVYIYKYTGTA